MKTYSISVDCYEVSQPDGGGINSEHIAYFSTRELAQKFVDENTTSWPKNIRSYMFDKNIYVCESIEDYKSLKQQYIAERALKKLTLEEREVLGLL